MKDVMKVQINHVDTSTDQYGSMENFPPDLVNSVVTLRKDAQELFNESTL